METEIQLEEQVIEDIKKLKKTKELNKVIDAAETTLR